MNPALEELDHCRTPLGVLTLWRRQASFAGGEELYEIRLDGEFLMSSLVKESETALATLALAELTGSGWDVLVGGLGLGHTAKAALDFPGVRSVTVIESLREVIDWHRRELVPLGKGLGQDPRCTFVHGDFFAAYGSAQDDAGEGQPSQGYHAILLDIDHSPTRLLDESRAEYYTVPGLRQTARRLRPGGVFAVWSADSPDEAFTGSLQTVFPTVKTHTVRFFNPLVNETDSNSIYIGHE